VYRRICGEVDLQPAFLCGLEPGWKGRIDMDVATLTIPLAFLAGLLSFASPCVLPLVPAYLGYLGSTTVVSGGQTETMRKTNTPFAHALAFVLGFMVVFILLGASATFVGQVLLDYRSVLERVGSVLLVIFGMRW
jgi:cytochrome c-type biogenesis protein